MQILRIFMWCLEYYIVIILIVENTDLALFGGRCVLEEASSTCASIFLASMSDAAEYETICAEMETMAMHSEMISMRVQGELSGMTMTVKDELKDALLDT